MIVTLLLYLLYIYIFLKKFLYLILRKPLHPKWWGVRNDKLEEISGIPDTVFCHASGFIGGNKTREGALKMALESLAAS